MLHSFTHRSKNGQNLGGQPTAAPGDPAGMTSGRGAGGGAAAARAGLAAAAPGDTWTLQRVLEIKAQVWHLIGGDRQININR